MNNPVIIAGAGPVGLVAALHLVGAGVPIKLIEKREGINLASRASTWHPSTLDILGSLGFRDQLTQLGRRIDAIEYRLSSREIAARFEFGILADETDHPFRVHLEQFIVSRLMLDSLKSYPNAEVIFDCEVTGVADTDSGVRVTTKQNHGDTVHEGFALLACDGASSGVATSLNAQYIEKQYAGSVLRLRTVQDLGSDCGFKAGLTYVYDPSGVSISALHMGDVWRIILRVPEGIEDEVALSENWYAPRVAPFFNGRLSLQTVVGKDIYRAKLRVADECRFGRTFLAGDSAHLTNTKGGMNMNAGIHDAYMLASALADDYSSGSLQKTAAAAAERHAVWRDVLIPRTDRIVSGGASWLEHIKVTAADRNKAKKYLYEASMLDMVRSPRTSLPV